RSCSPGRSRCGDTDTLRDVLADRMRLAEAGTVPATRGQVQDRDGRGGSRGEGGDLGARGVDGGGGPVNGDPHFDLWYLFALAGAVLIGAVLPVLPTGAAVSAGAVLASHSNPIGLVGVLIAGAGGAYLGDLIVYAGCRFGGERLA